MKINSKLDNEKVCAVVVTYNRRDLLRECLQALLIQTRHLDEIIVIDNNGKDKTDQMMLSEFPSITYLRLPENAGGAGGFFEGMRLAYEKGYHWIWLMDDDSRSAKECLERLMAQKPQADVLKPIQIDSIGRKYGQGYWRGKYVGYIPLQNEGAVPVDLFSFVGPLIHRRVIEKVGFPNKDFFIYGDDYEYSFRIRNAGFICIAVLDALIYHDLGGTPILIKRFGQLRIRYPQQDWKFYYSSRNNLLMLHHLRFWERVLAYLWYFFLLFRYTIGDLLYEPAWKKYIWFRWLGMLHGILGLTGKRVDPNSFTLNMKS